MEKVTFCPYGPLKTALKEAGLEVDAVVKQGKKTVFTVSLCKKEKSPRNSTARAPKQ